MKGNDDMIHGHVLVVIIIKQNMRHDAISGYTHTLGKREALACKPVFAPLFGTEELPQTLLDCYQTLSSSTLLVEGHNA